MKLRYRLIGILLLIGIYFGYREDPADQYVMVRMVNSEKAFPIKVSAVSWTNSDEGSNSRDRKISDKAFPSLWKSWIKGPGGEAFLSPLGIEDAKKIEAYVNTL